MSDADAVYHIALSDALAGTREQSASAEEFHCELLGKAAVQINAGALCVYDVDLSATLIADTSDSILFAQLAADHGHDRFSDPTRWSNRFLEVMAVIGWSTRAQQHSRPQQFPDPVDWHLAIELGLQGSALALASSGLTAANNLPCDCKAMSIWNWNAIQDKRGNFQVIAAESSSGASKISVSLIAVDRQTAPSGFLQWASIVSVAHSTVVLQLDEATYSRVRQAIVDRLGDKRTLLVANVQQ